MIEAMDNALTKKGLEKMLDVYQASILEAVNTGFEEARKERVEIRESINHLVTTLDAFLKRLTAHEDEFTILRAEVSMMKSIFKSKFGIEVSLQGK